MTSEEFDKLINKDKYQVFLFTSPCSFPINFAKHTWFVVNKKGTTSRWDVLLRLFRGNEKKTSWGCLYLNFLPATRGLEIIPFWGLFYWKSNLFKTIEGDEDSIARKMVDFINKSPENYPFCYEYSLMGANSNTYIQMVLDQFPELNIKLPWNCFGKSYKITPKNNS